MRRSSGVLEDDRTLSTVPGELGVCMSEKATVYMGTLFFFLGGCGCVVRVIS